MKIYTRIVMDMTTMQVEEAESYEYQGGVAECKGGGGGGDSVDKEYNRSMANIAESQQGMAEEMFNLYKYGQTDAPTTQYKVGGEWMGKKRAQDAIPRNIDQLQKRHVEDWETKNLGEGQTKRELKGMKEQYFIPDGTGEGHWGTAEEARKYIEGNPDLSDYESRRVGPEEGAYGSQLGLEQAQIKANMGLIPHQTQLAQSQMGLQQAEMGAATNPDIWGGGSSGSRSAGGSGRSGSARGGADFKSPSLRTSGSPEEVVSNHFRTIFNRDPDQEGLDFYVDKLESGEISEEALDDYIISGAQGADKENTYRNLVSNHYRNLFGRDPDPEGLKYWRDRLAKGEIRPSELKEYMRQSAGKEDEQYYETAGQHRAGESQFTHQARLTRDQIATQRQGLGLQSDYYSAMDKANLPQQAVGAQSDFLKDARDGVDVRGRMGQAQADVTAGYQGVADQQRLAQSRMGLNPNSGASQARLQEVQRQQAGDIAGARTRARRQAEDENFRRRQAAAQFGLQGLNRG